MSAWHANKEPYRIRLIRAAGKPMVSRGPSAQICKFLGVRFRSAIQVLASVRR